MKDMMIGFDPEFDTDALEALMELAEMPGQCIEHPEFMGNSPYSDYSMTPAMFADEYDLLMEGHPDTDFWEAYVTGNDEELRYVELICKNGVKATDKQSFIQHWDDEKITIVLYENDDELIP